MTETVGRMKSIWYFVGWVLLSMGLVILIAGLYNLASPGRVRTVLAELHPDIWWGGFMCVAGVLFVALSERALRKGR
ncbi:MAG: hypothetical protein ONB23_09735 [candidate division KSB1 bacterium]|nr:hypothetical protein [candidate division KSB1 bacterium]